MKIANSTALVYTKSMTYVIAILVLAVCFGLLCAGLLFARRALRKGCSLGPDCHCKTESTRPTPDEECEHH